MQTEPIEDDEPTTTPELNPWVSIWTQPRATIQQIVDSDPERLVLVLAGIGGFGSVLDTVREQGLGDLIPWFPDIVLICALIGPLVGIVGLYVLSFLLHWTGKWLGGRASTKLIRAAGAWGQVPAIWGILLWVPLIALFGQDLFRSDSFGLELNPLVGVGFSFGLIGMVLIAWSTVVSLHCLGQVQGFSAWKALGNMALVVAVVVIPIVVIIVGAVIAGVALTLM